MRVVANAVGYCGMALRQPGEEFDMPEDTVFEEESWCTPVGASSRRGKKGAPQPPAVGFEARNVVPPDPAVEGAGA